MSSDTLTYQIWLEVNTSDADFVNVYYRNSGGQKTLAGYVYPVSGNVAFGRVYYGESKDDNIEFDLSGNATSGANVLNITLDILGKTAADLANNYDDLNIQLKHASGGAFGGIGDTAGTEEADELQWAGGTGTILWTNLGTKNEDHRSIYGIVIKDPSTNGASDQVVLEVPSDQVFGTLRFGNNTLTTCTTPSEDLYINSDTILCSNTYYLNDTNTNGVIIINSIQLRWKELNY